MYFDALTLAAVTDELVAEILGGRVQKIVLMDDLTMGVEIYAPPLRRYLVMSAHPQLARVHLAGDKIRRGVETHSPLLLLLRKYVQDARVSSVRQVPYERVLHIGFTHVEYGETVLVIEVMGRHSNVVLLDSAGIIMECLKRVGSDVNRYRVVQPRQPYIPPPIQDKLEPDAVSELWIRHLIEGAATTRPVWRVLVDGIRGVSPLLAKELVFRAYGDVALQVEVMVRFAPLCAEFDALVRQGSRGEWEPCVACAAGEIVAFAPYALRHVESYRSVRSISLAVEQYVAVQASRDPYAAAKQRVATIIRDALKQVERKRYSLQRSLQPVAELDRLRRSGEWLLAYAGQIHAGQTTLRVDEGSPESALDITLDPRLTPSANAQQYFDRYTRAKKAAQEVPPLLEELALSEQYLQQLLTDVDLADSQPAIEDIRLALEDTGYLKTSRKRTVSGHTKPLSLQSTDGFTILVGKNSRQNDEVTFHRAAGDDMWLHARGVPGAHVIIRSGGRPIPAGTLRQAAQLAAYFSSARGDNQVAVDYTQQRFVRRIKGAGPGMVTYRDESTLYVAPEGP